MKEQKNSLYPPDWMKLDLVLQTMKDRLPELQAQVHEILGDIDRIKEKR